MHDLLHFVIYLIWYNLVNINVPHMSSVVHVLPCSLSLLHLRLRSSVSLSVSFAEIMLKVEPQVFADFTVLGQLPEGIPVVSHGELHDDSSVFPILSSSKAVNGVNHGFH